MIYVCHDGRTLHATAFLLDSTSFVRIFLFGGMYIFIGALVDMNSSFGNHSFSLGRMDQKK